MIRKKINSKDAPDIEQVCKNCDTKFIGRFCPNCSQSVKEFEQPISFMIVDFVGNMFAFDTRFWTTFKAVLYKPGTMTNEFVKGHRARYMPPFRFYIFMSFVFFFLLNYSINKNFNAENFKNFEDNNTTVVDSIKKIKVDSIIRSQLSLELGKETADSITNKTLEYIYKNKITNSLSSANIDLNDNIGIGNDTFNELKKFQSDLEAHPDFYISKALSYISWALFLFMPFFAFLLWMFFRKSYRYYVVHLIFAINQHAFLFIVLSVIIMINLILPSSISSYSSILLLSLPIYHFVGSKRLYKKSNYATIIRLLCAGLIYAFILLISFSILITISTFGIEKFL